MSIRAMMIGGAGASPPGAPTGVSAGSATSSSLVVSFSAPANNGGSAITSFTVTSSPHGVTATGSSSPITVSGLTALTSYTFTVTATNAIGTGVASSASSAVSTAAAVTSAALLMTARSIITSSTQFSPVFSGGGGRGPIGPPGMADTYEVTASGSTNLKNVFGAVTTSANGVRTFVTQASGWYTFICRGAAGGIGGGIETRGSSGGKVGGPGVINAATYYIAAGNTVRVVIGHNGVTGGGNANTLGGGGGGTAVSNSSDGTLYIIAGGGGSGSGSGHANETRRYAVTGNNGRDSSGTGAASGGVGGAGGAASANFSTYDGGGGGGWFSNGGSATPARGGISLASTSPFGGQNTFGHGVDGGYGGGGSAGDDRITYIHGGGGGGGYSGGAGSYYDGTPGGAGSFSSGTGVVLSDAGYEGINVGYGSCLIYFKPSTAPSTIAAAISPSSTYASKAAWTSEFQTRYADGSLLSGIGTPLNGIGANSLHAPYYLYVDLDGISNSSTGSGGLITTPNAYGGGGYFTSNTVTAAVAKILSNNGTGACILEIARASNAAPEAGTTQTSGVTRNGSSVSAGTSPYMFYCNIVAQWYS